MLDPHLDLFFGPLSPSHQQRIRSYSTPFKRTRVAAVEFARPPSRPLLRSTLNILPTARSITHLLRGQEWRLSSLLNPCLILFGPLSTSRQWHIQSCSIPFERTGVAAVEFARLPSRSLLRLILDIPPAVHSIMFNTLGEDGSGGCRVRSAPTLFSSSVDSQAARSIEFNTWKTGMAAMATATLFHFASTPAYQH